MTAGRYRTIVADPPWHYDRFGYLHQDGYHYEPLPYDSLTVSEICALDVGSLRAPAKEGSALFLWVTGKYLRDAFSVIDAWGFTYRQTITWNKPNALPVGGSVAPQSEFLLVARAGRHRWHGPVWPSAVVTAPASQHSRKPDVFQDLIEQISPGPYLELFARRQRLGWDTWGNEALEHVTLEVPA